MPDLPRCLAAAVVALAVLAGCTDDGPDGPDASPTAAPIGAPEELTADTASELVLGLYEQDAVDEALRRVPEEAAPPAIREDLRGSFEQILAREDVEVGATEEWEIDGVPILEVDTSDGIRWCVRPDGMILIQCRVGVAPVDVDTGGAPVTVARAEVDVFPEEQQLRLQLRPEAEPFTMEGLINLTDRAGNQVEMIQVQAALVSGGEVVGQAGRDTTLEPGTTLLLAWVTDVGATLQQDLRLTFANGAFDLEVAEPEYFVR